MRWRINLTFDIDLSAFPGDHGRYAISLYFELIHSGTIDTCSRRVLLLRSVTVQDFSAAIFIFGILQRVSRFSNVIVSMVNFRLVDNPTAPQVQARSLTWTRFVLVLTGELTSWADELETREIGKSLRCRLDSRSSHCKYVCVVMKVPVFCLQPGRGSSDR